MDSQSPPENLTFESQGFNGEQIDFYTTSEEAASNLFINNMVSNDVEITETEAFENEMEENFVFPPYFTSCDGIGGRYITKCLSEVIKPGTQKPYVGKSLARYQWSSLKEDQRKHVLKIFHKIPKKLQDDLIAGAEALIEDANNKAVEQAKEPVASNQVDSQTPAINQNTNCDDIARLLHIWHDPRNQGLVSRTLHLMNREELDDKENRESAWTELVNAYNNYVEFPYMNCTTQFAGLQNGVVKYKARADMEYVFEILKEINPAAPNRPDRNIVWMKQHLQSFKARFTKHYDNYSRSASVSSEGPLLAVLKK